MNIKGKKVSIIGAGNVGSTIAYTLTLSGIAAEIVLVDVNPDKAEGEAMDIVQGTAFCAPVRINAGGYEDTANSDIIIITAGMGRKPGMTRIDLCQTNIDIIKQIVPPVVKHSPNAMYVVVSNPVDILTYATLKISGLPENRVIGSGTMLDSARLRVAVAQHLNVNSHDVQAFVLGEHGDTSMVPWSLTSISGMSISNFCKINGMKEKCEPAALEKIVQDMRQAGADVIKRKGATFYAVSLSVRRVCEALLRDTSSVLTVSSLIHGQRGINDVCLSLPFIVGGSGLQREIELVLTRDEEAQLLHSADSLKSVIAELKF